MNVLGLNYFYHDSTACILVDGVLKVAIEEERLSRIKHTYEFPYRAIKRCMEIAGITYSDIDVIAVSIKPELNWGAKSIYCLTNIKHAKTFISHEVLRTYFRQKEFKRWLKNNWKLDGKRPIVHMVPHHLSHIAGSFGSPEGF